MAIPRSAHPAVSAALCLAKPSPAGLSFRARTRIRFSLYLSSQKGDCERCPRSVGLEGWAGGLGVHVVSGRFVG